MRAVGAPSGGWPTSRATSTPRRNARWAARDYPTVVWLLAAGVIAVRQLFWPGSPWLLVHIVLLGAATHSILVWSAHFAQALLRTNPLLESRRAMSARLWLATAGAVLVLLGVPLGAWLVTLTGAVAVAGATLWHTSGLWRRLGASISVRHRTTIHYYLAASLMVPLGATFGVLLAREPDETWHGRLLVAHTVTMVLGWVALTAVGTLVTLWPTMLRTRMHDRAEVWARHVLAVFCLAILLVDAAALVGSREAAAVGLVLYVGGFAWWARSLVVPGVRRPPREFASGSVSCALVWLAVGLVLVAVTVSTQPWEQLHESYGRVTVVLAAGFVLQLLLGALSYLVPVVLGGGPRQVRAVHARLNRWGAARLGLTNAAVLGLVLPLPAAIRGVTAVLGIVASGTFVVLLVSAIALSARLRRSAATAR